METGYFLNMEIDLLVFVLYWLFTITLMKATITISKYNFRSVRKLITSLIRR